MRYVAVLLCAGLALAQSQTPGKPGVTDPIKDPRQIPGHANPGPIPRSTPQAGSAADQGSKSEKKAKKTKKSQSKSEQKPTSK
jgi:hypothetical protein